MPSLQEQKSFTEKSSKALQDKEKELQKALKDAKVPTRLHLSHGLCYNNWHISHTHRTQHHLPKWVCCSDIKMHITDAVSTSVTAAVCHFIVQTEASLHKASYRPMTLDRQACMPYCFSLSSLAIRAAPAKT